MIVNMIIQILCKYLHLKHKVYDEMMDVLAQLNLNILKSCFIMGLHAFWINKFKRNKTV